MAVSTGGGILPVWSRKTGELFYRTLDNQIMVASYSIGGDALEVNHPRLWVDRQLWASPGGVSPLESAFDVAPDGKRFAVLAAPVGAERQGSRMHVTFLLNFLDELRRKAPGKN